MPAMQIVFSTSQHEPPRPHGSSTSPHPAPHVPSTHAAPSQQSPWVSQGPPGSMHSSRAQRPSEQTREQHSSAVEQASSRPAHTRPPHVSTPFALVLHSSPAQQTLDDEHVLPGCPQQAPVVASHWARPAVTPQHTLDASQAVSFGTHVGSASRQDRTAPQVASQAAEIPSSQSCRIDASTASNSGRRRSQVSFEPVHSSKRSQTRCQASNVVPSTRSRQESESVAPEARRSVTRAARPQRLARASFKACPGR